MVKRVKRAKGIPQKGTGKEGKEVMVFFFRKGRGRGKKGSFFLVKRVKRVYSFFFVRVRKRDMVKRIKRVYSFFFVEEGVFFFCKRRAFIITNLLRTTPIEIVKQIVRHKDIKTSLHLKKGYINTIQL